VSGGVKYFRVTGPNFTRTHALAVYVHSVCADTSLGVVAAGSGLPLLGDLAIGVGTWRGRLGEVSHGPLSLALSILICPPGCLRL
jgi:hypothetical protein